MIEIEALLKNLAKKTMFNISEDEIPSLVKEYYIFMNHVKSLEAIDTEGVEPLVFPYEIETTYLREDIHDHILSREDVLKNAKCTKDYQIKVPKVVKS